MKPGRLRFTFVKLMFCKFIAACLALSIGFAGMVGLSPALHQLVEHGGAGVAHIDDAR